MKSIITAIALACSTLMLPAVEVGKLLPKLSQLLPGAALPSSYLTDRKGVIRHVHSGY